MFGARERIDAIDCEEVRADAFYLCTHSHKHSAQLLDVWFASGIIDHSLAFCQDCCHDDVGGTGDAGLVEQHAASLETVGRGNDLV